MCSSRAVAIVVLALAARALPAIAQPAPAGPPPVDDPPPAGAPAAGPVAPPAVDPAPIEAEPSPPVATEPPPVAVEPPPSPSPPPVAPPPPPTPGAARGPVFGLEVGVGVTPGGDGLFGPGTGKAFMLGYRADRWTFEFRFGESYDQPAANARLADAGVRGPLRISSAGFRRLLVDLPLLPEVFVGGARIERPLLVNAAVVRQHGVGAVVGGALTRPLAGGLLLTAELRAYLVRWDNPPGPVSTEPVDGAATGVTFTPTTDAGGALPITATVGLRVLL